MKTLNRIVAALAVAFGLSTAAQAAELSRDWQKMCTGVTYLGSTAPNNLQYASSQRGRSVPCMPRFVVISAGNV